MQKAGNIKKLRPVQTQRRPGFERKLKPQPIFDLPNKPGTGKLLNKVALITGGDSGIGKAIAVLFAKEGADVVIAYLKEHTDAKRTAQYIKDKYNKQCLLVPGDISREAHCKKVISRVIKSYNRLDILINNAAVQYESHSLQNLDTQQMLKTFKTNIFPFFWLTKAALPHLKNGSSIINTSSVTAYRGSALLLDYSTTKGAIVSFTRSLSANLIKKGIRVNGVAPGPVWTPLIASGFNGEKNAHFGSESPMGRAADPIEIAAAYLFLASDDASYISGQFIHPNGGEIING